MAASDVNGTAAGGECIRKLALCSGHLSRITHAKAFCLLKGLVNNPHPDEDSLLLRLLMADRPGCDYLVVHIIDLASGWSQRSKTPILDCDHTRQRRLIDAA